jgi:hypothetical protein
MWWSTVLGKIDSARACFSVSLRQVRRSTSTSRSLSPASFGPLTRRLVPAAPRTPATASRSSRGA